MEHCCRVRNHSCIYIYIYLYISIYIYSVHFKLVTFHSLSEYLHLYLYFYLYFLCILSTNLNWNWIFIVSYFILCPVRADHCTYIYTYVRIPLLSLTTFVNMTTVSVEGHTHTSFHTNHVASTRSLNTTLPTHTRIPNWYTAIFYPCMCCVRYVDVSCRLSEFELIFMFLLSIAEETRICSFRNIISRLKWIAAFMTCSLVTL